MTQTKAMRVEITMDIQNACTAVRFAFLRSSAPRYWEITTVAPVATAINTLISRILIASTLLTPATLASPVLDTMMVSARPMVDASSCSMTMGIMSRSRFFLLW